MERQHPRVHWREIRTLLWLHISCTPTATLRTLNGMNKRMPEIEDTLWTTRAVTCGVQQGPRGGEAVLAHAGGITTIKREWGIINEAASVSLRVVSRLEAVFSCPSKGGVSTGPSFRRG